MMPGGCNLFAKILLTLNLFSITMSKIKWDNTESGDEWKGDR